MDLHEPACPTLNREPIDAFRLACADGGEFVISVIDSYVAESSMLVAQMIDAAKKGDRPRLLAAAHGLKGASLVMGAERLAALCERIENDLAAGSIAVTVETTSGLEEETDRVHAALAPERHP